MLGNKVKEQYELDNPSTYLLRCIFGGAEMKQRSQKAPDGQDY